MELNIKTTSINIATQIIVTIVVVDIKVCSHFGFKFCLAVAPVLPPVLASGVTWTILLHQFCNQFRHHQVVGVRANAR